MDRKVRAWDAKIVKLQEEAHRQGIDSALLEDVVQKQDEAHESIEGLRQAGADLWNALKAEVAVKTQTLQDALVRASERFEAGNPRQPLHEEVRIEKIEEEKNAAPEPARDEPPGGG